MAGFFDGEGCISIWKGNHYYRLMCSISQCNQWILELFKMRFGGKIHLAKGYNAKAFPIYHWWIYATNALIFLETIKPYLVLKRPEAEVAIEFQKRKGRKGHYLTDGEKTVEEAEYFLLKNLKREVKLG